MYYARESNFGQDYHHNNLNKETKIVKLIGNMKQNVTQLIASLQCHCGAQAHFKKIALVYCSKIDKLRKERDYYQEKYSQLTQRIQQQNKESYLHFQIIDSKNYKSQNKQDQQSQSQILFEEEEIPKELLLTSEQLLKNQINSSKYVPDEDGLQQLFQYSDSMQKQHENHYETDFLKKKLGMNNQNIEQYLKSRKQRVIPKMITKDKLQINQNYKANNKLTKIK